MELRRYADDDLKRKLEPVEGVAAVKVGPAAWRTKCRSTSTSASWRSSACRSTP
jgi:hypothetical protein